MINAEMPRCPMCLREYGEMFVVSKNLKCGHTLCTLCLSTLEDSLYIAKRCPVCQKDIAYEGSMRIPSIIENKKSTPILSTDMQCSNCKNFQKEEDLQFCSTCLQTNKDDNTVILDFDIKSLALCCKCTINKHAFKGHIIEPFFNLVRVGNTDKLLCKFTENKQSMHSLRQSIRSKFDSFTANSDGYAKLLEQFPNILKNCSSSKEQNETANTVQNHLNTTMKLCEKAEQSIESLNKIYQKSITDLQQAFIELNKLQESRD